MPDFTTRLDYSRGGPAVHEIPTEGWCRSHRDTTAHKYHWIRDGRPLCGARTIAAMTLPRQLTPRQIETQACTGCVRILNREASQGQEDT